MRPLNRSTIPLVCGDLGEVNQCSMSRVEQSVSNSCCLVAIDGNEQPAGGPVDRHQDDLLATSRRPFVAGISRQYGLLGLIRFEATVFRFLILGLEITKTSHTMPTQVTS